MTFQRQKTSDLLNYKCYSHRPSYLEGLKTTAWRLIGCPHLTFLHLALCTEKYVEKVPIVLPEWCIPVYVHFTTFLLLKYSAISSYIILIDSG
jgi:hypothetical protein